MILLKRQQTNHAPVRARITINCRQAVIEVRIVQVYNTANQLGNSNDRLFKNIKKIYPILSNNLK